MGKTNLYANDLPGPRRTEAYLIFDKEMSERGDFGLCGKIVVAFPKDGNGKVVMTFNDWTNPTKCTTHKLQTSGYGYDKLAALMAEVGSFGRCQKISEGNWKASIENSGYAIFQAV